MATGFTMRRTIAAALAAACVATLAPANAQAAGLNDLATGLKASPLGVAAAHAVLFDSRVPIVVLGARLNPDCSAPAVLDDRLATARGVALLHPANPIVVTGGHTQPGCQTEAEYMRDFLVRTLVDPARIHVDTTAYSTVGNAQATADSAGSSGNVMPVGVLVTSPNHIPRAIDTYTNASGNALWLAVPSTVN
ncbi:YdcF family protein [Corynebacterium sp. Z-1]|uniref:YdcF family protein n=1 Tax=Corynebacterium sp. Z-1 TaxID=3074378 RepID=UPI0028834491|nr:YdcF family protein [Corynebacterium sp. Z-1]WNI12154.1 YdcF family protein [Corynebacterium sp. Z-1]